MIYNSIPGVPNFVSEEFVQKRSSYCICIPIINEGRRIHDELKRARKYKIDTILLSVMADQLMDLQTVPYWKHLVSILCSLRKGRANRGHNCVWGSGGHWNEAIKALSL